MEVDVFRCENKHGWQLVLPAGSIISELDGEMQKSIAKLGKLTKLKTVDLSSQKIPLYIDTIAAIKKEGAHFWTTKVVFTEGVGNP